MLLRDSQRAVEAEVSFLECFEEHSADEDLHAQSPAEQVPLTIRPWSFVAQTREEALMHSVAELY